MVAEPRTFVDVEGAVRQWARDVMASTLGGRRVFFEVNDDAPFPQIALFRISGPDDRCLIQFDVWGQSKTSKAQAQTLSAELATAVEALGRYTYGDVLLHGATVEDVRWQPDEESRQARYVVDTTWFATAHSVAAS